MKEKKRFYKKWWFWAVIVFIIGVALSPSEEEKQSKEVVAPVKQEIKKEVKPIDKLKAALIKELGEKSNRDGKKIESLTISDKKNIVLKFKGDENLTEKLTISGAKVDIGEALRIIKESKIDFATARIIMTNSMVDKYGNAEELNVVVVEYNKSTVDKINFEHFDYNNVYEIADYKLIHPAFQ